LNKYPFILASIGVAALATICQSAWSETLVASKESIAYKSDEANQPDGQSERNSINDNQTENQADESSLAAESNHTLVITARKRTESLQEYAGAATAIGGDDFSTNLIDNLQDLRNLVPNLYLEEGLSGGSTTKVFIRGIGMDNPDSSFDSPVGIYVDGVYHARPFGALTDLYDVERVEFLRGPQGTLFGRNNSAGALRVISKRPVLDSVESELSVGVGNESQLNTNLFVNLPLQESVSALRFAISSRQNDGFMTELNSGKKAFIDDVIKGRATALFALSEQWELVVRADYMNEKSGGALSSSIVPAFNTDDDIYTASLSFAPAGSLKVLGTSFDLTHESDQFDFTSITAYRSVTNRSMNDPDGTPLALLEALIQNLDEYQFTEEAYITTDGDTVDWTAGIFMLREKNDSKSSFNVFPAVFGPATTQLTTLDTEAFAIYAEADFKLSERLTLTTGLRYTDESKEVMFESFNNDGSFGFDFSEKLSVDKTTWKIAMDYVFSDDLFAYFSAGTGFRSGGIGINPAARDVASVVSDIFEPETAESYETGFKSSFLDNTVTFNATYFYVNYQKLQLAVAGVGGVTVNTPDARVNGLEAELSAKISDGFSVDFTLGTQNDNIVNSDLELKYTPDKQARLGLIYTNSLPNNSGEITFAGDVSYTDDYFMSTANSILIEGFSLVNLMAKWESVDGRLVASLSAKNINDKYYPTAGFRIVPNLLDTQYPNRGRTWLASVRYSF